MATLAYLNNIQFRYDFFRKYELSKAILDSDRLTKLKTFFSVICECNLKELQKHIHKNK